MIQLTLEQLRQVRAILERDRLSTDPPNREEVNAASRTVYEELGYPLPSVIWFSSFAAYDYVRGMTNAAIPYWYHPKRLNPDLSAYDPDIPDAFWDGIEEVLPEMAPGRPLGPRESDTFIGSEIIFKAEELIPAEVRLHASRLWPRELFTLAGHEEQWWGAFMEDQRSPGMAQQTIATLWSACCRVAGVSARAPGEHTEFLEAVISIGRNCCTWYPLSDVVLAIPHPLRIYCKDGRPHHETEPAVVWRDGVRSWCLNGVRVPRWLVETRASDLNAAELLRLRNAQVRCEFVRKIGIERICRELKARTVDQDGDYELLLLEIELKTGRPPPWYMGTDESEEEKLHWGDEIPEDEGGPIQDDPEMDMFYEDGRRRRPYLKMVNPSTGTYHIEGVHPDCWTVREALAWRNGTGIRPTTLT